MQRRFPNLALLSEGVHRFRSGVDGIAGRTVLVCVQHLLETTGSLFEALLELGVKPRHTFVLGKLYSTNADVASRLNELGLSVFEGQPPSKPGTFGQEFEFSCSQLWHDVTKACEREDFERIVVLDDGGHCSATIPPSLVRRAPVVGIEQTTSGLARGATSEIPIIQVAASAAKRHLEPPMISRAVVSRVLPLIDRSRDGVVGVIGIGQIGFSIATALAALGLRVLVFDRRADCNLNGLSATRCRTLEELIQGASTIFGCTGEDVFKGSDWIANIHGRRRLISCSSEDREFRELLLHPNTVGHESNVLSTHEARIQAARFEIVRGGFPVNFDGGRDSVPADDIQLTRFLLLAAVAQAMTLHTKDIIGAKAIRLSAESQRFAFERWLHLVPARRQDYPVAILREFANTMWIDRESASDNIGSVPPQAGKDF